MITHIPYHNLGQVDHGWLNAHHHFSFGQYYHPNRMGFGALRVINDDLIKPNSGFPAHPHDNMEIITYVRSGAVSHEDNQGNKGVTKAGEIQVMSAGTGIIHSEYNLSAQTLSLYQIWLTPNQKNVTPRWETKTFPETMVENQLPLLVSGYQQDHQQSPHALLFIHQEARLYGGKMLTGTKFTQQLQGNAYLLASEGKFKLSATESEQTPILLTKGDGAEIVDTSSITITAQEDCEIVLIELAN